MNYQDYNDNELLSYIAECNEEANEIIYKKYMPLITKMANKLYKYSDNLGLEVNDLIQEGMLGLTNAIREYKEEKDITFYTFAKTCVERKMITLIVSSKRLKHRVLNESISFNLNSNGQEINLEELIGDDLNNPENLLIDTETFNELVNKAKEELTEFELQVFELKISDFNYKEIASILEKDSKSVDNALQRIKAKLKKYLQ